jgi:lambda family phage portal protein
MAVAAAKPRIRVPAPSRSLAPQLPASLPAQPKPSAGYMRAFNSPMFLGWHPALREASDDVKQAWRLATARTVDAFHNSGFLAASREKSVSAVIGDGLDLDAKPNAAVLGWSDDQAAEFAGVAEQRWHVYVNSARSCDALACNGLHQLAAQAYSHSMATGEILATLPYFQNVGSAYRTKLRILPAWRISQMTLWPNLVQGVFLNEAGAPIGYRLINRTPMGLESFVDVLRYDAVGRPVTLHIYEGEPDQYRGISDFTPVLKVVRQFDQLADATLTTTLIQTIFAGMFKSAASPEQVLDAVRSENEQDHSDFRRLIEAKASWYEKTDINLGAHGKLLHGFPGDELQFFRSEHPNAAYQPFAQFLLLEAATACALTKEEFTGDYTGATYSSIQMGTAVNWPRVERRRKYRVAPLYRAVYEAWLEEEIEAGALKFPGGIDFFLANRDAVCGSNWVGPIKPQADELKTAKAAQTLQAVGFPDSVIYAMYGRDRDDMYAELKREKQLKKQYGIDDPPPARPDPVGDALLTDGKQGGGDNADA